MTGSNNQFSDGHYLFDAHLNNLEEAAIGNGVVTGFGVTEKGAGADKTVDVAAGTAVVNGTIVTVGSTTNVDLSSYIDGADPKKVLIVLEDDDSIAVVDGVAAAADPVGNTGPETKEPELPDKPTDKIILAEVWLEAGETTIQDADITDRRIQVLEFGMLENQDWTQYNILQGDGSNEPAAVSLAGPIDECVVPAGAVIVWPDTIASIPSGFVICDGNNGTENLLQKFLQGVATAATNPGATGGSATHTLVTGEIPAHTHTSWIWKGGGAANSEPYNDGALSSYATQKSNGSTGGGGAHANEPPFHDVAFIMKT